ncbi:DNA-binding protein [Methylomicrobium lacus]|uniref:DNA-binding protein n=1 Tax=Methylomicrobium lacus TaxID=136992 RepID=UPI0035A8B490
MAAPKLIEEDVHAACAEIVAQGERPTALTLLDKLGRGSLTTITKYLNTWHTTGEAQALKIEALPAVVKVPAELSKEGEDLLKKMWNTAKGIADEELDIQREALQQAEQANQAKVEEAFKFSEAQSMKIDRLEDIISDLKAQLAEEQSDHGDAILKLNEVEKVNVGLSKDNDRLQHEIGELKKQLVALEEANKAAAQEKKELQQEYDTAFTQKDAEIRALDIRVNTLQTSLDSAIKTHDQIKADLKSTNFELSRRTVEIETLSVRHEAALAELKTAKADLTAANQAASEAEKLVANLQGQLEVYVSLERKELPGNDNK